MKFLPRTIFGRTLLVLLVGLTVSHLVGLALYAGERRQALTAAGGRQVAERIAAVAEAVENVPAKERPRLVLSFLEPGFRVTWSERSALTEGSSDWHARLVRSVIRDHLGDLPTERIRVAYGRISGEDWWRSGRRKWWRERMRWMGGMADHMDDGGAVTHPVPHMGQGPRAWRYDQMMEVSLQMADKSWLNFAAPAVPVQPIWASPYLLSIVLATAMVLALSAWAVRRATEPLALFAHAAERLGTDVNAPALVEEGPREVRRAAAAFNEMQRRLGRFIRDRTQMLAAVSHDLRTPITRLRLRAEFVEDAEQRKKMLADLEQMESMIAATLAFARDDAAEELRKPFDLGVLLQDLCDDAADAGHAATYEGAPHFAYRGRPTALKRAFVNLIDNAIKYGGMAKVALATEGDGLSVVIEDEGPGITEDELEKVFTAFYRVEPSRSRESGGTGLGLAVVRSVVRGHGGDVVLANRVEGGLRATVTLPVA